MNRIKQVIVLCILLVLPLLSVAGWLDQSGNPLPDTDARKSIGKLGVNLLLTNKEKEAQNKSKAPSSGGNPDTIDKIKRNEFITALLLFSGCGVDEKGNCDLLVKYKILQPDGKVYADIPVQKAWAGKPPADNDLQVSKAYIKIRIENKEPLGVYQVMADVVDKVSGESLSLLTKFEAIE